MSQSLAARAARAAQVEQAALVAGAVAVVPAAVVVAAAAQITDLTGSLGLLAKTAAPVVLAELDLIPVAVAELEQDQRRLHQGDLVDLVAQAAPGRLVSRDNRGRRGQTGRLGRPWFS